MATGMRQLTLSSRADRADYSQCCVKTLTTEQCCCHGWRGLLGVELEVTDKNHQLYSIVEIRAEEENKTGVKMMAFLFLPLLSEQQETILLCECRL